MAKIEFCIQTAKLREMAGDGREAEARAQTIGLLRKGFHSKPFLKFVADLLEPPARGKGAPSRPPRQWLDIGSEFELLRDRGVNHLQAVFELAEKFKQSERTIERAVKIYRGAKEVHDTAE